jgi:hypothetical protein
MRHPTPVRLSYPSPEQVSIDPSVGAFALFGEGFQGIRRQGFVLDITGSPFHNDAQALEMPLLRDEAMADPQDQLFTKLRGIIGGYLVDLILEEGGGGIAHLVREGLEVKARLEPEDEEKVMQLLRRLEEG